MSAESDRGQATRREIFSQPGIWESTLRELVGSATDQLPDLSAFDHILFTGCGSTYFLSQWAARLCQQTTGVLTIALPASELLLHPANWIQQGANDLLVAVSRSAETTETILALEAFVRLTRGDSLAVICNPQGPLARHARHVLAAPQAQETSVAQTRSFTSMMLLIAWLISDPEARQAASALPAAGGALLAESAGLAQELGQDQSLDKFFFLGSGPLYGLASEGMLKMKEMSLSHSEAYHFMEIRHGPMSMVDDRTVVFGLMGSEGQEYEAQVIEDMRGLQARAVTLRSGRGQSPDNHVDLGGGALPAPWRGPLYLPFLQLVAFHRAMAKGLDPDRPMHLEAVVKLNG